MPTELPGGGDALSEPDDPNFMTSLARGLTVIRAFTQHEPKLTIAEVARIAGLPRAAARRCLLTLTQLGYAGTDGRSFHLRPKVLALGYSYLSSTAPAAAIEPVLEQISRTLQESASAAVLDDGDIVYIARAATRRIMSVGLGVGSRLPAWCTAMGRVLLANLPPPETAALLDRIDLAPRTDRTITSRDGLRRVIDGVRRDGYALVDQELEIGLRSIAVPIRNRSGTVVAAMNISVQAARVGCTEMTTRFLPVLRDAAEDLRLAVR